MYSPDFMVTHLEVNNAVDFFKASRPVSNLRVIRLSYRLYPSLNAIDDAWRALGRAFAGNHFTRLQKLHIDIEVPVHLRFLSDGADLCGRPELARAHILDIFHESMDRSFPVEVELI